MAAVEGVPEISLLPGVPKAQPGWKAYFLYRRSKDLTYEKIHTIFWITREGEYAVTSDPVLFENVIVVFLRHKTGMRQAEHAKRAQIELEFLKSIFGSETREDDRVSTRSALLQDAEAYHYMYGPDLTRRETTVCGDIASILAAGNFFYFLRFDLGSLMAIKPMRRKKVSFKHMKLFGAFLLHDNSLARYPVNGGNVAVSTDDLVSHLFSGVAFLYKPVIHNFVMGEDLEYPGDAPVAKNVNRTRSSHGSGNTFLHKANAVEWIDFGTRGVPFVHSEGFSHLYSELSYVRSELSSFRLQKSLFPFIQFRAACIGMYYPNDPLDSAVGADKFRLKRDEHYKLASVLTSVSNFGVPIVNGFLRPVKRNFGLIPNPNHYIHRAHIGSFSQKHTDTVRLSDGLMLVAMGEFIPAQDVLEAPCVYADSGFEQRRIETAFEKIADAVPGAFICDSFKRHSWYTVKETIFTIIGKKGVNIYVSKLPPIFLNQITRPNSRLLPAEYGDFLKKYFLNVVASVTFILLENKRVKNNRKGLSSVLEIFIDCCRSADCPVTVLGTVVNSPGIHFKLDIDRPIDFDNPVEKINLFSVINNKLESQKDGLGINSINKTAEEILDVDMEVEEEGGENSDMDEMMREEDDSADESSDDEPTHLIVGDNRVDYSRLSVNMCVDAVLSHESVAGKEHLVRHMNRCSNGLVAQQPGVGPLDIPVADYSFVVDDFVIDIEDGVVSDDYNTWDMLTEDDVPRYGVQVQPAAHGTAMAVGEQAYKMALSAVGGGYAALTEALTNIVFAPTSNSIEDVIVSMAITWCRNTNYKFDILRFLDSMTAFAKEIGVQFCVNSITEAQEDKDEKTFSRRGMINAVCTATCPGTIPSDSFKITPDLKAKDNVLIFLPTSREIFLSGSIFQYIFSEHSTRVKSIHAGNVRRFYDCVKDCMKKRYIVSGHDISDGGLLTCLIEMAISGNRGVSCYLPDNIDPLTMLFSETPGAVVEVELRNVADVIKIFSDRNMLAYELGYVDDYGSENNVFIMQDSKVILNKSIGMLLNSWRVNSTLNYSRWRRPTDVDIFKLNAYGEYDMHLGVDTLISTTMPYTIYTVPDPRCRVAVLCFPGSTGHIPLLTAFTNAGFLVSRVLVDDIRSPDYLERFSGLVIGSDSGCSDPYLGARAQAVSLVKSTTKRTALQQFFRRPDTFSLGVGSLGTQVLLSFNVINPDDKMIGIPNKSGVSSFIDLAENKSNMYESRWLNFKVSDNTNSIFFSDMKEYVLPCWAQGTHLGFKLADSNYLDLLQRNGMISCTYHGRELRSYKIDYPMNPSSGIPIAAISSQDGRHTASLFNPALAVQMWQWQYVPEKYKNILYISPWTQMFISAHIWSLNQSKIMDV